MAYLILTNGNKRNVPPDLGMRLWNSLHDPSGLDEDQLDYLKTIKAVFLNWHKAPDEYVAGNLDWIIPLALNDWRIDRYGKHTRPDSDEAWRFAKRWGLWEFGAPTALVRLHS